MRTRRLALVFTALLVAARAAVAASPCADDLKKLCADEPSAGGKVQACLEAKAAEVSEPCKKHLDEVKGWQGPLVAPCRFDLVVLCADVEPGGGRLAKCLEGKKDQLTTGCKDKVGKPATP